jgi:hypothetical protein
VSGVGHPVQALDRYHVYNVAGGTGAWTASVNGALQTRNTANVYGFVTSPALGYGGSCYFAGEIAEVIVFDRVLEGQDRNDVTFYLNTRYRLVDAPSAPSNLTATGASPTQISLTWVYSLPTNATSFKIERRAGGAGAFQPRAVVVDATSYFDPDLQPATGYTYRVRSSNPAGDSDYSNEANASTLSQSGEVPMGNLALWLKADAGVLRQAAGGVRNWFDQSGNLRDAKQTTATAQPVWTDGLVNGRPVLEFEGNDTLSLPNVLNGTTQAEIFVVLKADVDKPATPRQLWDLGGGGANGGYPATGGIIAESFGSTTTRWVGDPVQPLDQYHLYNVAGQAGEWAARINGMLQARATGNVYAFEAVPVLGYGAAYYFSGDLAEIMIFNRVLNEAERESAHRYLNSKYHLVMAVPERPTNVVAVAISSTQVSLTWEFAMGSTSTVFQIERKAGIGGSYLPIMEVRDATSFLDGGLTGGMDYAYRVKAVNFAGESDYSDESTATTLTATTEMPLGDLRAWFRADCGVLRQNTNGTVAIWFDQSGHERNGSQGDAACQPLFVPSAAKGRPSLRFDGVNDRLAFPNLLNGTSEGEVFVVLKAAADPPGTQRQLWRMGQSSSFSLAYPNTAGSIVDDFGSSSARTVGDPAQPLDDFHL